MSSQEDIADEQTKRNIDLTKNPVVNVEITDKNFFASNERTIASRKPLSLPTRVSATIVGATLSEEEQQFADSVLDHIIQSRNSRNRELQLHSVDGNHLKLVTQYPSIKLDEEKIRDFVQESYKPRMVNGTGKVKYNPAENAPDCSNQFAGENVKFDGGQTAKLLSERMTQLCEWPQKYRTSEYYVDVEEPFASIDYDKLSYYRTLIIASEELPPSTKLSIFAPNTLYLRLPLSDLSQKAVLAKLITTQYAKYMSRIILILSHKEIRIEMSKAWGPNGPDETKIKECSDAITNYVWNQDFAMRAEINQNVLIVSPPGIHPLNIDSVEHCVWNFVERNLRVSMPTKFRVAGRVLPFGTPCTLATYAVELYFAEIQQLWQHIEKDNSYYFILDCNRAATNFDQYQLWIENGVSEQEANESGSYYTNSLNLPSEYCDHNIDEASGFRNLTKSILMEKVLAVKDHSYKFKALENKERPFELMTAASRTERNDSTMVITKVIRNLFRNIMNCPTLKDQKQLDAVLNSRFGDLQQIFGGGSQNLDTITLLPATWQRMMSRSMTIVTKEIDHAMTGAELRSGFRSLQLRDVVALMYMVSPETFARGPMATIFEIISMENNIGRYVKRRADKDRSLTTQASIRKMLDTFIICKFISHSFGRIAHMLRLEDIFNKLEVHVNGMMMTLIVNNIPPSVSAIRVVQQGISKEKVSEKTLYTPAYIAYSMRTTLHDLLKAFPEVIGYVYSELSIHECPARVNDSLKGTLTCIPVANGEVSGPSREPPQHTVTLSKPLTAVHEQANALLHTIRSMVVDQALFNPGYATIQPYINLPKDFIVTNWRRDLARFGEDSNDAIIQLSDVSDDSMHGEEPESMTIADQIAAPVEDDKKLDSMAEVIPQQNISTYQSSQNNLGEHPRSDISLRYDISGILELALTEESKLRSDSGNDISDVLGSILSETSDETLSRMQAGDNQMDINSSALDTSVSEVTDDRDSDETIMTPDELIDVSFVEDEMDSNYRSATTLTESTSILDKSLRVVLTKLPESLKVSCGNEYSTTTTTTDLVNSDQFGKGTSQQNWGEGRSNKFRPPQRFVTQGKKLQVRSRSPRCRTPSPIKRNSKTKSSERDSSRTSEDSQQENSTPVRLIKSKVVSTSRNTYGLDNSATDSDNLSTSEVFKKKVKPKTSTPEKDARKPYLIELSDDDEPPKHPIKMKKKAKTAGLAVNTTKQSVKKMKCDVPIPENAANNMLRDEMRNKIPLEYSTNQPPVVGKIHGRDAMLPPQRNEAKLELSHDYDWIKSAVHFPRKLPFQYTNLNSKQFAEIDDESFRNLTVGETSQLKTIEIIPTTKPAKMYFEKTEKVDWFASDSTTYPVLPRKMTLDEFRKFRMSCNGDALIKTPPVDMSYEQLVVAWARIGCKKQTDHEKAKELIQPFLERMASHDIIHCVKPGSLVYPWLLCSIPIEAFRLKKIRHLITAACIIRMTPIVCKKFQSAQLKDAKIYDAVYRFKTATAPRRRTMEDVENHDPSDHVYFTTKESYNICLGNDIYTATGDAGDVQFWAKQVVIRRSANIERLMITGEPEIENEKLKGYIESVKDVGFWLRTAVAGVKVHYGTDDLRLLMAPPSTVDPSLFAFPDDNRPLPPINSMNNKLQSSYLGKTVCPTDDYLCIYCCEKACSCDNIIKINCPIENIKSVKELFDPEKISLGEGEVRYNPLNYINFYSTFLDVKLFEEFVANRQSGHFVSVATVAVGFNARGAAMAHTRKLMPMLKERIAEAVGMDEIKTPEYFLVDHPVSVTATDIGGNIRYNELFYPQRHMTPNLCALTMSEKVVEMKSKICSREGTLKHNVDKDLDAMFSSLKHATMIQQPKDASSMFVNATIGVVDMPGEEKTTIPQTKSILRGILKHVPGLFLNSGQNLHVLRKPVQNVMPQCFGFARQVYGESKSIVFVFDAEAILSIGVPVAERTIVVALGHHWIIKTFMKYPMRFIDGQAITDEYVKDAVKYPTKYDLFQVHAMIHALGFAEYSVESSLSGTSEYQQMMLREVFYFILTWPGSRIKGVQVPNLYMPDLWSLVPVSKVFFRRDNLTYQKAPCMRVIHEAEKGCCRNGSLRRNLLPLIHHKSCVPLRCGSSLDYDSRQIWRANEIELGWGERQIYGFAHCMKEDRGRAAKRNASDSPAGARPKKSKQSRSVARPV